MNDPTPKLQFRPCTPSDVEAAVPLIFSSGPAAFRFVFSHNATDQALDFLRDAFVKGGSEFGYQQHTAAVLDGQVVGVGGVRFASQNLKFTAKAAGQILSHYSVVAGLQTAVRGLRIEQVLHPPKRGVGIVYQLGVDPAFQSQGIGRQLIAQLLDQIWSHDISVAALDVAETNPRAQALYEELGFTVKERRAGGLQSQFGHVVDHFYMELQR